MEKIGSIIRKTSEDQIRNNLKEAENVFIIGFPGLTGPDMNSLRLSLRGNKSRLFVIKNSISKRVFNDLGLGDLTKMLEGPCGLVFVKDDLIGATKTIYNFSKEHETFKIGGGVIKDRILSKADVVTLANLPSKEVLYAKVVIGIKSPISNLVGLLNNTLRKFVLVLDQIKNKIST